ncbi:hypothetical protein [Brazilian marseillevirus]|uniref:hypothetical protein n=1 Tax=Brazilian marseillevirus TaxID=1813599 RepID=UPI0007825FF6|nr:hypothetical protein A3303_gp155 [Brazilian marseillevirus]AMQ10663.1 hypothetical protein [Brazilian marseillevirus]
MEPMTSEKLDALRNHVQTLNDQLDHLRLQYDICEKKTERERLEKEIIEIVSVLDPLTCDLFAAEEAVHEGEKWSTDGGPLPQPLYIEDSESVPQEIQAEWLGRLVKDTSGTVYRVTFVGEITNYLERQRLLYDPVRWMSADGKTLTFPKSAQFSLLTGCEIFFPGKGVPISDEFRSDGTISPFWMGKLVKKQGFDQVFRVMSKVYGSGCWRLAEMKKTESGLWVEGEFLYVAEDSPDWCLYKEHDARKDKGKEKV